MNNDLRNIDLITAARIMQRKNAKVKRTIQAKRSSDAKVNAATKGIKHDHFPTYYKYG